MFLGEGWNIGSHKKNTNPHKFLSLLLTHSLQKTWDNSSSQTEAKLHPAIHTFSVQFWSQTNKVCKGEMWIWPLRLSLPEPWRFPLSEPRRRRPPPESARHFGQNITHPEEDSPNFPGERQEEEKYVAKLKGEKVTHISWNKILDEMGYFLLCWPCNLFPAHWRNLLFTTVDFPCF